MNHTELSDELSNHTGTSAYYFNPLYKWMKYTDGVKSFAENAGGGAYWFLDIVGTELKRLASEEEFLSVTLTSSQMRAKIHATDGDDKVLYQKQIPYTDCPPGVYNFFLTNGVMLLTSEY